MTTQHNCYTPATMLTGARSQGVWHSLITMPKDDDVPPMPAGMYGASIMNSDLVRIRVILTRYADFLQAGGFDPALPNADISTGERASCVNSTVPSSNFSWIDGGTFRRTTLYMYFVVIT